MGGVFDRFLEIGADRILYSTNYPYETMVECEE
jgi:hypothetical protein